MSWAIWITGLPGSGKSAIAHAAAAELHALGEPVRVLELDEMRKVLTPAPAYSEPEREVVYRTLVYLALVLTDAGVPVIVDATGHRRGWRDLARASIRDFAEVQLECPLDRCRERARARTATHAPRGVYAAADRPGAAVPGVNVAYEPALSPELVIDTTLTSIAEAAAAVSALGLGLRRGPARPPAPRRWALWITGLPGSGKKTITSRAAELLNARGVPVRVLAWADLRAFAVPRTYVSELEQDVLHRGLGCAAKLLTEAGVPVIVEATAARRAWRELARRLVPCFAEVQLVCPREICVAREQAVRWSRLPCPQAGHRRTAADAAPELVPHYEHALGPELTVRTDLQDPWTAAEHVARLAYRLHQRTEGPPPDVERRPSMRVRDLMSLVPITVGPTTPVLDARQRMLDERIRHLLVCEGSHLVGIVTDRDIRLNLPSPATSLSVWEINYLLARLTVGEVMSKAVIVVEPDRDAAEAARIMLEHKIGALPVMEANRVIGIVTETDFLRAFAKVAAAPTAAVTAAG